MTNADAKELSIKLWSYLVNHPECRSKEETPYWEELRDLTHNCPLCAVVDGCPDCPIYINGCILYYHWLEDPKEQSNWCAKEILRRITEWKV